MSAIGALQTSPSAPHMSAFGGKADIKRCPNVRAIVVSVLGAASRFVRSLNGLFFRANRLENSRHRALAYRFAAPVEPVVCEAGAPAIMSLLLLPAQIPLTTINASAMVTPIQALASQPRLLRSWIMAMFLCAAVLNA